MLGLKIGHDASDLRFYIHGYQEKLNSLCCSAKKCSQKKGQQTGTLDFEDLR